MKTCAKTMQFSNFSSTGKNKGKGKDKDFCQQIAIFQLLEQFCIYQQKSGPLASSDERFFCLEN